MSTQQGTRSAIVAITVRSMVPKIAPFQAMNVLMLMSAYRCTVSARYLAQQTQTAEVKVYVMRVLATVHSQAVTETSKCAMASESFVRTHWQNASFITHVEQPVMCHRIAH